MNAKQFAWAYLIKNGAAGVTPSLYGGLESQDLDEYSEELEEWFNKNKWSLSKTDRIREAFLKDIKKIGVSWEQTKPPVNEEFSIFVSTFADSYDVEEKIAGYLILNDGRKQYWCADQIEVSNVFEIMADQQILSDYYEEIFGS